MFGDFQRYVFICYLLTVFSAIIFSGKTLLKIRMVPIIGLSFFVLLVIFSYSSIGDSISQKFSDVLTIFDSSAKTDDHSVNARVSEADFAMLGFYSHPIVGNGIFRSSNRENILGDNYFYLSDVGLLGLLYAFGILGPLVYFRQFFSFFRFMRNGYRSPALYYLFFILIFSILTGLSVLQPTIFIFCYFLIIKSKVLI
jgi:hypothetical protein